MSKQNKTFVVVRQIPRSSTLSLPRNCFSINVGLTNWALQIAIIAVAIFAILVITYLLTLKYRRPFRGARKAKQASDDKLPSLFSWKNLRNRPRRNEYSTSLQDTEYRGSTSRESREMSGAASADPERQSGNRDSTTGVDRNTSVRSVMTLPAYSMSARENERILGREGERAGMDNVVELPETVDEEERQREEEMESLYQIRLARRVEAADREARRQARRDARARGDVQALADIRRRAEEAADLSVSQMLIAEHQANTRTRDRRVSSVAYGDLGVARHDGTRLRANSSESDNRPLLDSAASISGQSGRSRAYTNNTLDLDPDTHQRGLSVTSIARSFDSRASDESDLPDASRSNSRSNNGTSDEFEVVSLNPERSHSGSRAPTPSVEIPTEQAPAYEDPPNYESPVTTRAPQLPQLPQLERLPSIHVTTEPTPVDERSHSSLR
ncbi:Nn.00g034770.m01.CDS01 [Neocucurbitaria sp. VM-36]